MHAISSSRAEGIVMPFNVRNRHETFANEQTEFGLDLFPHKPFLYMHMLDGRLEVHGEVNILEIRKSGLWGQVEIDEFAHDFIQTKRAGFSTGSLPQLVAVTGNGYLTRWIIVELSFGEEQNLANRPGTTTAILQSFSPKTNYPIERGIWTMLPEQPTPEEPVPQKTMQEVIAQNPGVSPLALHLDAPHPKPPAPPPNQEPDALQAITNLLTPMQHLIQTLDDRLATLEEPPGKELPEPTPQPAEPPPNIKVKGRYDDRSLAAMLFEHKIRAARALKDPDLPWTPDNEWYRTVATKIANDYTLEDAAPELLGKDEDGDEFYSVPSAPIPTHVYEQWTERVPFLHADEVMRSDFTSFGLELVPTLFSTVMYHFMRAESVVFSKFQAFTPPSYPTWKWPTITAGPTWRRVLEAADDAQMKYESSPIPASKIGTANRTFTAGGIGARTLISDQLLKGSSVPLLDAAMLEYMRSAAAEKDWLIMNGDETNTTANISHLTVIPAGTTYDKVLVVDGLRHMTIVTTTADSAAEATIAITTPAVGAAKMGARGVIGDDIENVFMFACPESARKFYALTAYHSSADVGESRNSLLKGFVGNVGGYDLFSTPSIELADSDGKYTNDHSAGTVGQIVFAHRNVIKVAIFFPLRILADYVGHARTTQLFANTEIDVNQLEIGGTACLFNNTV